MCINFSLGRTDTSDGCLTLHTIRRYHQIGFTALIACQQICCPQVRIVVTILTDTTIYDASRSKLNNFYA